MDPTALIWDAREMKHVKHNIENDHYLSALPSSSPAQVTWRRAAASRWSRCFAESGVSPSRWTCVWRECCRTGTSPLSRRRPPRRGCCGAPEAATRRRLLPSSVSSRSCRLTLCTWWGISTLHPTVTLHELDVFDFLFYDSQHLFSVYTYFSFNTFTVYWHANCQ